MPGPRPSSPCALLAMLLPIALAPACRDDGPRALVLADGSGPALSGWVDERTTAFEQTGRRPVRVLRVPSAEDALNLATRGDADVALVPEAAPVDRFVDGQHGREAGRGPGGVRVLVVDGRTHPKVDAQGAQALASQLLEP